jgi:predicted ATPase/DNA-binding SARP family transcriptional activator
MPRLEISLLGPFRVHLQGEAVTHFKTAKVQALLAYLAVEADRPHARDALTGLLWPEQPEAAARLNLRQTLHRLRQVIPPAYLLATRPTIQFDPHSDYSLDVTTFTKLMTACQNHLHPNLATCQPCLAQLQQAIALYRSDFLANFFLVDSPAFEEWALLKREWLRREALQALFVLATHFQQQNDYDAAYQYAWRQLELDSLREEAYQQLMLILALSGRRSEALAQYDTCCQTLAEALDVEPAEATTDLYERILTGELGEKIEPKPSQSPHNLPVQTTPFIGREVELSDLARLLADPEIRLVSILSAGGMGKTRLALEAGKIQLDRYPHGIYFASLAPLDTSEAFVPTIAEALNFSFYEGGTPQQQLLDYLREKRMLLILDNFEHLLSLPAFSLEGETREASSQLETLEPGEYATSLVTNILQTAPDVKIMVTSRERLRLQEEQLFHIGGIDFPDWETVEDPGAVDLTKDALKYSAVKLFLQSARRVQPDFALTTGNVVDVVQICRSMQGMPLGILLAAAWVEMLSPAEIADQISGEIGRSLDFLATDWRNVPERQRSVRAVFDHSWRLLTRPERAGFQQLSIFRGGFTRQAAREVAGASLRTLTSLVNKSVLDRTSTGRYDIHELTRQFAAEKLSRSPDTENAVRSRHSAYYRAFLQQRETDLKGARQQTAVAEIEMELKNAQVAWNWAVVQRKIEWLTGAMESLGLFYEWRGRYREGEAAFRLAAEQLATPDSGEETRFLARSLVWQALFNNILGRSELVDRLLQQSFSLLDRAELGDQDIRAEKAFALRVQGLNERSREKAKHLTERSLVLYQALGDRWGTAEILYSMSTLDWLLGNYDQARQLCEESLTIRQALADKRGIAASLSRLGAILNHQGKVEEAERLLQESLTQFMQLGDRSANVTNCLFHLGISLEFAGKFAEARETMRECFQMNKDLGNRIGTAAAYEEQGHVEILLGAYQQGRIFIETIQPTLQELNMPLRIGLSYCDLGMAALAEKAYAEARQLLEESVTILRETKIRLCLSQALAYLALAERGLNNTLQAQQCLAEAIQIAVKMKADLPLWDALPAAALLLADRDEKERSMELYALAFRNPYVGNCRWFEDVAGHQIAAIAATLPTEKAIAAQARGKARDLGATAKELLAQIEDELSVSASDTAPAQQENISPSTRLT